MAQKSLVESIGRPPTVECYCLPVRLAEDRILFLESVTNQRKLQVAMVAISLCFLGASDKDGPRHCVTFEQSFYSFIRK